MLTDGSPASLVATRDLARSEDTSRLRLSHLPPDSLFPHRLCQLQLQLDDGGLGVGQPEKFAGRAHFPPGGFQPRFLLSLQVRVHPGGLCQIRHDRKRRLRKHGTALDC
jgi:hypothetical protein